MPIYVALLRGINVGGKKKVPMPALREAVEALGHTDVTTYIQSGNVVFKATKAVKPASLEAALEEHFGMSIDVALRTAADLDKVLAADVFADAPRSEVHVGFLTATPAAAPAATLAGFDAERFAPEACALKGTELFLHLPNGMGRAKLPDAAIRRLGVPVTVRNWNTVTKLAELARA